jgi:hypothetical protein
MIGDYLREIENIVNKTYATDFEDYPKIRTQIRKIIETCCKILKNVE